ncbi:MAG: exonuclease domain-containing protein, partial [Dehalococcoidia bacterium]
MAGRTYVAVDLETTGLEAGRDRITEVGMVRFRLDGVLATYTTLVNPERPIPFRIERLTGISNADVREAPRFGSVRLEVEEFLGDAAVVGQNVQFDLAFLAEEGIVPAGPVFDTLQIAALLEPQHRDQSLAALAERHGVEAPVAHRALADAETTRQVYLALYARARALPEPLLRELLALPGDDGWPALPLLEEIAAERELSAGRPPAPTERRRPAAPIARGARALTAEKAPEAGTLVEEREAAPSRPPKVDALAAETRTLAELSAEVLAAGSGHPEHFGVFEKRAEQAGMTRAVAEALDSDQHLMVEAGTGTGKSLAYLIPTSLQALRRGARVIVSTNTLNLQEQLLQKDVPALRTLLRDAVGDEAAEALRVAPLKGRRNYLCLRRVAQERYSGGETALEAKLLGRILVWLRSTETGDRAEIRVTREEEASWVHFSAEGEDCLSRRNCPYVRDGTCFLLRARKRAEGAHVVIVNHALLLSDMAAGGTVLPAADTTVIDEAHHLESAATQHLGASVAWGSFNESLDRIHRVSGRGSEAGLVVAVRVAAQDADAGRRGDELLSLVAPLPDAVEAARDETAALFTMLRRFVEEQADDTSGFEQRLRLTAGRRAQPLWSRVEVQWENAFAKLRDVDALLESLQEALEEGESAESESLAGDCASVREALAERSELCGTLLTRQDAET